MKEKQFTNSLRSEGSQPHLSDKQLYPWQEECIQRWFRNDCRGMVQAVTGSGKTRLALAAAERLQKSLPCPLRIRIVVPTGALMRQWHRAAQDFLFSQDGASSARGSQTGAVGMVGGGFQAEGDGFCTIYVINSARYRLARQILADLKQGNAVLLIADECHRYASGQNRLIFEFLPYLKDASSRFCSMGLSATLPSGEALRFLSSALGRKIYSYGMAQAASARTICRYDLFHISLSFDQEERDAYDELSDRLALLYATISKAAPSIHHMSQTERFELLRRLAAGREPKTAQAASQYMGLTYKRKNLVCLASARVSCALELLRLLPAHERILVFGERISQAEELYQLLQKAFPGRAARYHSQMGRQANQNALERFRNGEVRILITCKSLDEGLDVPEVSIGIILSGTSTQRQRIQRLGRIIRQKEGKSRSSLYYLHVSDTAEDSCFLPDAGKAVVSELGYDRDRRSFTNPPYEKAAFRLTERLERRGMNDAQWNELLRCLRLGLIRCDWRLSQAWLRDRNRLAADTSEKNYWFCMEQLHRISREGPDA